MGEIRHDREEGSVLGGESVKRERNECGKKLNKRQKSVGGIKEEE